MRLIGIVTNPGTFIGFTERKGIRIGLIANELKLEVDHHGDWHDVLYLRPARTGEHPYRIDIPRSVAEHEALPRIRTVYGMGRTFNPETNGLGPVADNSYLQKLRQEKNIKIARRRNRAELAHLYRLREGK